MMLMMVMIIKRDDIVLRNFKFTGKANELIIQQHKEGKFVTLMKRLKFKFMVCLLKLMRFN